MVDYASQTVAQLKEVLKDKGLPIDGKKADLVQRLKDSDENTKVEVKDVEEAKDDGEKTEEVTTEAVENAAHTDETKIEATESEKSGPKVLSPDERKQLAVNLLNKKIQRAEKFGDEAAASLAKKDLARVEKFGVELGTSLAQEIGLVDNSLPNGKKKFFKKRGGYKKNFKNFGKPKFRS